MERVQSLGGYQSYIHVSRQHDHFRKHYVESFYGENVLYRAKFYQ